LSQNRYQTFPITYSSRTREQFAFSPPGFGGKPKLKEGYREVNGCSNRSRQGASTSFGWLIGRNGTLGVSNPNKGSGSLEKSQIITIRGYPAGVQRLSLKQSRSEDRFSLDLMCFRGNRSEEKP
jgi:hypothetical protein